ncbi:Arginine-tRNA-protein transferase [Oesophagostomum dentatum]|uniref:Arginine-tRNA-protein transferase n=1 Tax=Oesophagostomum dentatum TaxID=61180 RepID=A0A0B1SUT5_OESDE|nr:Arginine-tRNA-protein transferase [Oesophagostomum dentatum]
MVKWSIIEYCGLTEKSSCGYCKNAGHKASLGTENEVDDPDEGDSVSFGLWAHTLSCANYQKLLDKGWRRSGKYIYKPTMEKTCCPQYTIRLDSTKFTLSRSQRRVLRHMNEFLKNDTKPKSSVREEDHMEMQEATSSSVPTKPPNSTSNNSTRKIDKSQNPVQKKKEMRRQRCLERWKAKGLDVEEMKKARVAKEEARRRTVESYILDWDSSWKHKLELLWV